MFIAKFLDQKQGEARVVDQKELLRDRLGQWLKTRPSAADLAERGILGRAERFLLARTVLDQFLRARAQEAEHSKIPAGTFSYTPRVRELLAFVGSEEERGGPAPAAQALQARLDSFAEQSDDLQRQLQEAEEAWASAAEACRKTACGRALPEASMRGGSVLQLLEEHRVATGGSLRSVFEELGSLQRLVARRQCLAGIVAVVEKTDAVREALRSGSITSAAVDTLEELPGLCSSLPSRSRSMGSRRLRCLVRGMRAALAKELQRVLAEAGRWPLDPTAPVMAKRSRAVELRAIQLCADLQRTQAVEAERRSREQQQIGGAAEDEDIGPWACCALTAPLLVRFRLLFCRPESELCKLEKPEWAFRYLVDLSSDHADEVHKWFPQEEAGVDADGETEGAALLPGQLAALREVDLPSSLAVALAQEAKLFVRARLPLLAGPDARPLLFDTMRHFVRFHGDISACGGEAAGIAAFADFDANRPLRWEEAELPATGPPSKSAAVPGAGAAQAAAVAPEEEAAAMAPGASGEANTLFAARLGAGLVAGLSQLRSREAPSTANIIAGLSHLRSADAPSTAGQMPAGALTSERVGTAKEQEGFLDLWAAADAEFVREKLLAATGPGSRAWRPRSLCLSQQGLSVDVSLASAAEEDDADEDVEEPEAAELATLVTDLFEASRGRAECLSTTKARAVYCSQVLDPGLRQVLSLVRAFWNDLPELLQEARKAALAAETMEELCCYFDQFPLSEHMVAAVDEANELRLNMLSKLADSLADAARKAVRRLHSESCIFSFVLAPPLMALVRRLRPSNVQLVLAQGVERMAQAMQGQLLRQAPFASDDEIAVFASNCADDLAGILGSVPHCNAVELLRPLRPLLDSCALLTLPSGDAEAVLAGLRKVAKCSPATTGAAALVASRSAVQNLADATEATGEGMPGEVLRGKEVEIMTAAGVQELSTQDAISVLLKRPDLMGTMTVADLEDAPLASLQDLLPSGAAQATLQLGAGALEKLGAQPFLQMGAGAAQATLQLGARGLAGRLRSTLSTAAATTS